MPPLRQRSILLWRVATPTRYLVRQQIRTSLVIASHLPTVQGRVIVHQFLLTFLSLFVSLCHHSTPMTQAQMLDTAWSSHPQMLSFPNRYQLAQQHLASVYAEPECLSCRPMNSTYIER